MKAVLGVAVVLLMAYGVDQYFNGGSVSDVLFAMLRDIRHGFGV
jgi:hypothetical protein